MALWTVNYHERDKDYVIENFASKTPLSWQGTAWNAKPYKYVDAPSDRTDILHELIRIFDNDSGVNTNGSSNN